MDLNELPDEMLCTIFDHLDVYELELASLVCRRWSELTFSGRRMHRVWLMNRNSNYEFLFNTKRKYRNVHQPWVKDDQIDSLVRLLHTIKPHVRMLVIDCALTWKQLGSILLEIPAIQHLSISDHIDQHYNKNNTPFRVLPELKSPNRRQLFSFFRMNISNLQCLKMSYTTVLERYAWKILSGQLKLVYMYDIGETYLHPFLELTFPRLEDLTIELFEFIFNEERDLERSNDFFRRHPFVRRLSLGEFCSVKLIRNISHHCPELTHLSFALDVPEDGILESLVRLTKLKHLSLEGNKDRIFFRGAFKSLQTVELDMLDPQVLLENLFKVVPRLSCLRITDDISCDELQFICEKFSYLRRLELIISSDEFLSVADDSVRIDELMHLQELELSGYIKIRSIHRNNVRCLRITSGWRSLTTIMDDDLYQIPGKFPLLKRLTLLNGLNLVSVAAVKRLHKLMPSCRIDCDFGKKRFYPIDDVTAD